MMQYPSSQFQTGDSTGQFASQNGATVPNFGDGGTFQTPSVNPPMGGVTGGMSPQVPQSGGTPADNTPTGIQAGTVLGQVGKGTYNPMAGWDVGKLNNPNEGVTTKYKFGRFVQDQGYDPVWARSHMGDIADAFNKATPGAHARALVTGRGDDDQIDFGEGYAPIDLLNSNNYWQWLVGDSGQQPGMAPPPAPDDGIRAGSVSPGAQPYQRPQGNFLQQNNLGMYGAQQPNMRYVQ
jgi:hypothetical protein